MKNFSKKSHINQPSLIDSKPTNTTRQKQEHAKESAPVDPLTALNDKRMLENHLDWLEENIHLLPRSLHPRKNPAPTKIHIFLIIRKWLPIRLFRGLIKKFFKRQHQSPR
ncbi:MAG TPA: hypothetical protein VGN95_04540 [Pyrinomonadaceae bacterium]|nr:hypothetical protein [Pyrinomonadaceae bacterium]